MMAIGLALIIVPIARGEIHKQPVQRHIIEKNTDARGLTSVVFTEGEDTFAFDYLTSDELIKEFPPVYVEYFKHGQVLEPDMSCPDTLIVMDAEGLNRAFAPIEQGITGRDFGDYQYDSLFHLFLLFAHTPSTKTFSIRIIITNVFHSVSTEPSNLHTYHWFFVFKAYTAILFYFFWFHTFSFLSF